MINHGSACCMPLPGHSPLSPSCLIILSDISGINADSINHHQLISINQSLNILIAIF